MTLGLSNSDYVAIIVGLFQLITTVGIGIWAARRTAPPLIEQTAGQAANPPVRLLLRWLKSSFLFMLFFAIAVYGLYLLAASDEPISKAYVFKVVFVAIYALLNLYLATFFFIYSAYFKITEDLVAVARGTLKVQRDILTLSASSSAAKLRTRSGKQ